MATMMDFLPTFAKLSGAKITKDREIDGYDIFPLMTNKSSSTPYPFLCYYGRDGQLAAIRQGEWKLHLLEPSEKWAGKQPVKEALLDTKPDTPLPWLYNLNEDVGETKNIAGTNQITVNKLTSLAKAFDLELTKKLRPAYDESVLRNSSLQLLPELNYPEQKYIPKTWKSFWIKCPDAPEADYAVTLYRRTFELKVKPEKFIIHVSADNRYKLFVNGKLASIGPQLSEPKHWRYETIDIAPYLQTGKNNLAAEVANWGPDRFFGIMSVRTGFFVQGNTDAEAIVNTGDKWIAFHNKAISPIYLNWVYGVDIVGGFYASNPGDSIQVAHYPEMWNTLPYDDSSWASAKTIWRTASDNESGHFWLMKARTTPQVIQHGANFAAVVRSSGIQVPEAFLSGKQNLTIPAYTRCSFLLDFKTVTLGFPELTFSGGKGAKITIRYAENLLTPDLKKGDRNVVEGKAIRGIHDVIMPDGRNNFVFAPLWYRGFRYVQLDIETTNEPLNIKRFQHVVTQSPMQVRAKFECDDAEYMRIDEICRRTAEICTQDNLMSDAYYEQMMYVADSKIHALVNLFLSGDPVWLKNAIEQFGYSQTPAGVITSCYPVKGPMHHSNFTLYWIDMMHDYMMYCPEDKDFLRQYVNGIRAAFDMFESGMLENGLVGNTIGKFFIDWYNEPAFPGQRASPGSVDGNS
jgi:hypothetical protein